MQNTLRSLRGRGKLNEKDVDQAIRDVRLALLEADVNFKVVKNFVTAVRERAVGQEVLKSLTPGQQVVKIVHEELTALMGEKQSRLEFSDPPPALLMLVGLQGSGKTTTAVKLASYLRGRGHRPLLVAADIYRPGAIRQLEVLGREAELPYYSDPQENPVRICSRARQVAVEKGYDRVLLDTAGRLHLDREMMSELQEIKAAVQPAEVLLVVDAMTGQDAVNAAGTFHREVGLTGVILTKLDGDTRGGAALSVRAVTGCPVKFAGVGEKIEALEPFHPERMASRILGMGDILTLIEKAEASLDQDKAREMQKKLRTRQFTLDDFRDQLDQLRRLGPLDQIMTMLPGAGALPRELKDLTLGEKQLDRVEAIICSMTPGERCNPAIINSRRRRRIACGSGTTIQEVNRLLQQFAAMQKMLKKMGVQEAKGHRKKPIRRKRGFPFF